MELTVATSLIDKGVTPARVNQVWADLGCGSGLFTSALSTLLPAGSTVHAIDKDIKAILELPEDFKNVHVNIVRKDFVSDALELFDLDGILMANSLHYVNDKASLFDTLKSSLKPSGKFIIVEYERSTSNQWVPFPIGFEKLQTLAMSLGFKKVTKLAETSSAYSQGGMYSAVLRC